MKVIIPTPQTGPLALALGTAVVWVPHLATETLLFVIVSIITLPVESLHAFMLLVTQIDSVPEDSSLGFLIFKANYYFTSPGPGLLI